MVDMKKFLVVLVAILSSWNIVLAVDGPVELTAPKPDPIKNVTDSDLNSAPSKAGQATTSKDAKTTDKKSKQHKHKLHLLPKKIVIDYNKVSKLIEYNYYDDADKILQGAIDRNSKDIKAQSLWVVSLAKQCKLDPAQNELNYLIKKYPNNSNLHYAQGVIYYQRSTSSNMVYRNNSDKLINDAMIEFKKAIDLDKNNARAYNAAGVISLSLNKPNDAKVFFQKSLKADKTYSMAIDNLGTMDFAQGKFNDAAKKFKQSLTYNTQNTTAMYHLAQVAIQKKDYTNALMYLNNALAINSNSPAIYNLMGKSYLAQGNGAAAINAFRQSIMVKPEFTLSYLDLADVYANRGDSEFAIEQLKTVLSIEPDYYDAKLKLADISLKSGKYKQSINVYSSLVGVNGYNDAALKGLANAYYGQAQVSANKSLTGSNKDLYKALDYINKAIAVNNQDLELHLAKLKIAKLANQPTLTKTEADKIISATTSTLADAITKGEAYIILNDYKNAEKSFDTAINLSDNPQNDSYLAEILIYNKQYKCAEKILQKILNNDEQNQQALDNLDYVHKSEKCADNYFQSAQYFIKAKNFATSIEYLNRSLAINPDNAQANLLLAKLYEKKKDYQNAAVNYKTYLEMKPYTNESKAIQKKINNYENRL